MTPDHERRRDDYWAETDRIVEDREEALAILRELLTRSRTAEGGVAIPDDILSRIEAALRPTQEGQGADRAAE